MNYVAQFSRLTIPNNAINPDGKKRDSCVAFLFTAGYGRR